MNVVVVESPAKAKTINKYLGKDFTVLASYGHVRDLPSRDGSVRPDDEFDMDWEVDARAQKHIKQIADALKGAKKLYLATDPDREGEAISWHVREVLDQRHALKGVEVKRVVFNEITKTAILDAFGQPRDLDRELVEAYLARRALDYLVGFTLSPVLWRKLPGSRSAGRVQSVALRLVCERETEIEIFVAREYWTVRGEFMSGDGRPFHAMLTHLDGHKLDKFGLPDAAAAEAAVAAVAAGAFSVAHVERRKSKRNPAPPFTTSTLQQEAARKLFFAAKRTMSVAQKLYEGVDLGGETVGLITYMRTDGVQMAQEAIQACRSLIGSQYGSGYLPDKPRIYKTKAKNAQEAHEAIRPTDVRRRPEDLAGVLSEEQLKLYTLIWRRTIASQMEAAVLDQVAVDVGAADQRSQLRANGSVIAFDGFLKVYREGRDDGEREGEDSDDDRERILPPLREGEPLKRTGVTPTQHFTQPPPRFTEASLVKRMEELGIGRPSTYASILSVLQEREYVRLDKRQFVPEDRGRLVTAFLTSFFGRYVEYSFTADLEERLDDISGGRIDWKTVLREFWKAFSAAVEDTKTLRVSEVLDALDRLLGPHFFPESAEGGPDPRACPKCADGRLNLKLGRFGAFIGCSNYPDCRFTRPLVVSASGESSDVPLDDGPRELGQDPVTGFMVTLRKGPYGYYVQLGEASDAASAATVAEPEPAAEPEEAPAKGRKAKAAAKPKTKTKAKTATPKPRRASLARGMEPATVDLDKALALLSLPREVGVHPETGETIVAAIGRFGPYIKHGATFLSLKGEDDVLTIGMNRAVDLLASAPRKDPPRELGAHPEDKKPVTVRHGRFGPYAQHGALRATLPKGLDLDTVTLEQAVTVLAAKAEKDGKAPARAAVRTPAKRSTGTGGGRTTTRTKTSKA